MLVAPTVVSATSTCCVFSYLYFLALTAPTLAYVMQFSQRIFIAVRWLECPIVKVQNGHHEIIKFKFSKPAKKSPQLANICWTICAKFHQNRHNRLGCRADTERHTHTHTPSVSIATYSVKMTEYKKQQIV